MPERLRIATWNLDHASNSKRPVELQIEKLLAIDPDILVLTETCKEVDLTFHGFRGFPSESNEYGKFYSSIHLGTRVRFSKRLDTYDDTTAVCIQADTPIGEMLVYATIITWHGDKGLMQESPNWTEHYKAIADQGADWKRLLDAGASLPLLVAGDFNQTRDGSSRTYGTAQGRQMLGAELSRNHLTCLTTENFGASGKLLADPSNGLVRNNIDHICATDSAFRVVSVGAWDHFAASGKYLSDHNGVFVDLESNDDACVPKRT